MKKLATFAFVVLLLSGFGIQVSGFGIQEARAQQIEAKVGPRIGIDRLGLRQLLGVDVHVPISESKIPFVINPTFGYYLSTNPEVDFLEIGEYFD